MNKVARLYGLEGDSEMRVLSQNMLDETITEMNSWTYEFNKVVLAGVTLVQDQQEYALPTGFYKESQCVLVDGSDNDDTTLHFLPWVHFSRTYLAGPSSGSGVPISYSIRNTQREGEVHLYPKPGATLAGDYTLRLEYYRRIPLVSEEDPLEVPPELEAALVFGAQKRMAIHIKGPGDPDVASLDSLEARSLERLQASDRRTPDANTRFRLATRSRRKQRFRDVGAYYIG